MRFGDVKYFANILFISVAVAVGGIAKNARLKCLKLTFQSTISENCVCSGSRSGLCLRPDMSRILVIVSGGISIDFQLHFEFTKRELVSYLSTSPNKLNMP